jgi:hypothetical protein
MKKLMMQIFIVAIGSVFYVQAHVFESIANILGLREQEKREQIVKEFVRQEFAKGTAEEEILKGLGELSNNNPEGKFLDAISAQRNEVDTQIANWRRNRNFCCPDCDDSCSKCSEDLKKRRDFDDKLAQLAQEHHKAYLLWSDTPEYKWHNEFWNIVYKKKEIARIEMQLAGKEALQEELRKREDKLKKELGS